ncbi:MAG: DUF2510 domain-containing protein [Actinomycetia bacterium]|nr:DUF2510 domain-containing protein [Actinomycetes bacterium]
MANPDAGWYNDPTGRYSNRYWDGMSWTDSVSSGGSNSIDPVAAHEGLSPPAPGTDAVSAPQPTSVATETNQGGSSGVVGIVLGALALLIAIVLVIAYVTGGDDNETPTDTTDAPEVTQLPEGE